jgi:hypothetical protein
MIGNTRGGREIEQNRGRPVDGFRDSWLPFADVQRPDGRNVMK